MTGVMKLKPKSRQKTITEFINQCSGKNTAKSYRNAVIKFLDYLYGIEETRRDPTQEGGKNRPPDMEFYDALSVQYLAEPDRDYADDLQDFILENKNAPGTSRSAWKAGVVQWLGANKIYLHPQETRQIKAPRRPQTLDRIPTRDELRMILDHGDLQSRALILVLSSSGMRVGEALQLKWRDVDMEHGMIRIRGEITKTQTPRVTFISQEAMAVLKQWNGYHASYIEGKRTRRDIYQGRREDRDLIFPTSYSNARGKFTLAMEKAGLDERCGSTDRFRVHIHVLRKYFRTKLPQGGASVDVVEELMGHEGYLSGAYLRLTDEEIEKEYRAAESALWIFKEPAINTEELKRIEGENVRLREEGAKQQQEAEAMKKDIEMLVADYLKMKGKVDVLTRNAER